MSPNRWDPSHPESQISLKEALGWLRHGGLLLHPTEGVWGVGCVPGAEGALEALRRWKSRPLTQGFILLTGVPQQLFDYLSPRLDRRALLRRLEESSSLEAPVTWLIPAHEGVAEAVKGRGQACVAVRVTPFKPILALTQSLGSPLLSSSANLRGEHPIDSEGIPGFLEDYPEFACFHAPLGPAKGPSEIRIFETGEVVRAGGLTERGEASPSRADHLSGSLRSS